MQYWRITNAPDERQLEEIARLLSAGGVLFMPADTIYGLHALATNERAVRAISLLKRRDSTKPFLVLVNSFEALENIGVRVAPKIREALDEIWPAPLTAILPLDHPIAAARGGTTLAVRIPAVDWLRDLAARAGPIASTSANESGQAPAISPSTAPAEVLERVDGIVDAGTLEGKASALVDLSRDEPVMMREGESLFTQEMWKTLRKKL